MNSEIIATVILICSFLGIGILIFRKIPVLVKLPDSNLPATPTFSPVYLYKKLIEKIKNIPGLKSFSFEIFLQKLLSKTRILTLRIENKIANYLQKLREKARKKNDDNYWQELKKPANGEDKNSPE